jgi:hypothetical protein
MGALRVRFQPHFGSRNGAMVKDRRVGYPRLRALVENLAEKEEP